MKFIFGSYQAISILEGGVKTQILSLKNELEKLGHQVVLFDAWQNYMFQENDYFHLFCAHIGTYHLAKAIKALGAKLIITPVIFSRRRHKFIRTLLPFTKFLAKINILHPYQLAAELFHMANCILPNTQQECLLIKNGFKITESKIKLLPNGVNERFYNSDPSIFIDKYKIKNFILYVGHIGWPRKNVLNLLRVLKDINHPVVLIGKIIDNDYSRQCLDIVRSRNNIIVINDLQHNDPMLASAYAACDTLVLPSWYETPGLAALEAALAGAKIVITKYGGTREYFNHFAQYVNPFCNQSIKQAIINSLVQKKDDKLKEHIYNNFLWSHIVKKLINIYNTLKIS